MEKLMHSKNNYLCDVRRYKVFSKSIAAFSFFAVFILVVTSCKKLVTISDPVDQIVTNKIFSSDDLADAAMNGVYNGMIRLNDFSGGGSTLYGALSADEIICPSVFNPLYFINTNHISIIRGQDGGSAPTDNLWSSAYGVVYTANAVIEGIGASTSSLLRDTVRKTLTAEAKFVRAFCYFYLTNFYGDVPLILATDYNATVASARSPQSAVYQQIIQDLKDAQNDLPADYSAGGDTRVRVNKWAATALLSRAYLFVGEYANAIAEATRVINNSELYQLESDLNNTFLIPSKETIWQLNQMTSSASSNATPDGANFSGEGIDTLGLNYFISPQLLSAFEPGDARLAAWTDSAVLNETTTTVHYAYKYKSAGYIGGDPTQYYVVLRLAEQYLIRADAEANGGGEGAPAAIADLNIVRARATLPSLNGSLSQDDLSAAVAHEWQTEFFCEWGLRWFNLKRNGRAHDVLSAILLKQPWAGDYQLLYPIPGQDIARDNNLTQNIGY